MASDHWLGACSARNASCFRWNASCSSWFACIRGASSAYIQAVCSACIQAASSACIRAVGSSYVPRGSDSVIRLGARREGVRGSGHGGGDSCSTTSEPSCDVAATSLSRCRHRRNLPATFSALQVGADGRGGLCLRRGGVGRAGRHLRRWIVTGGEDWE